MTEFEKWKKELELEVVAKEISKTADIAGGPICDLCPAKDYCVGGEAPCYDIIMKWGKQKND